ncbi:MAG: hypothetical protein ACJAZO_001505 [Myxococcota bacterium]|jgi:hypothetical protein
MYVEHALLGWKEGTTDLNTLMRALVTHPAWLVARNPDGSFNAREDDDGKPWLTLFHSPEAEAEYSASTGHTLTHRGIMAGYVAVIGLLDGMAGVDFDPGTPLALHLPAAEFGTLVAWARAIQLEHALVEPSQIDDPFSFFHDFDSYYVVVADQGAGEQVVMAPDRKGRTLFAVFTALDAVQAFVAERGTKAGENVRVLTFSGGKLFATLSERELDGIVFNCAGPVAPMAFQPGFIDEVLAAAA